MKKGILLHEAADDVGVAAMDLAAGEEVQAVTLDGQPAATLRLVDAIPLGHKAAMRDLAPGKQIIEYGRVIGAASAAVPADAYRDIDRSVFEPDDLAVGTHEVYVWYANGAGRSKLNIDVPATKGIAFTARNWNTVLKLRDLLSEP